VDKELGLRGNHMLIRNGWNGFLIIVISIIVIPILKIDQSLFYNAP